MIGIGNQQLFDGAQDGKTTMEWNEKISGKTIATGPGKFFPGAVFQSLGSRFFC